MRQCNTPNATPCRREPSDGQPSTNTIVGSNLRDPRGSAAPIGRGDGSGGTASTPSPPAAPAAGASNRCCGATAATEGAAGDHGGKRKAPQPPPTSAAGEQKGCPRRRRRSDNSTTSARWRQRGAQTAPAVAANPSSTPVAAAIVPNTDFAATTAPASGPVTRNDRHTTSGAGKLGGHRRSSGSRYSAISDAAAGRDEFDWPASAAGDPRRQESRGGCCGGKTGPLDKHWRRGADAHQLFGSTGDLQRRTLAGRRRSGGGCKPRHCAHRHRRNGGAGSDFAECTKHSCNGEVRHRWRAEFRHRRDQYGDRPDRGDRSAPRPRQPRSRSPVCRSPSPPARRPAPTSSISDSIRRNSAASMCASTSTRAAR